MAKMSKETAAQTIRAKMKALQSDPKVKEYAKLATALVKLQAKKSSKETAAKSTNATQILRKARTELTAFLKSQSVAKRKSIYTKWINWFDYDDLIGDGIPEFNSLKDDPVALANQIMDSDPMFTDDGLIAFLYDIKVLK